MSADVGRLTYNGIALEIVRTHHIGREVQYENGDYIGVKHTFDVTGVYNPQAMAYVAGGLNTAPKAKSGTAPPTTDAAVRDALSQPRQTLVYTVGGITMLTSPQKPPDGTILGANDVGAGGSPPNPTTPICDVTGGPYPLKAPDVIQVQGEKTFIVRFVVSTVINESYLNVGSPTTLLSNRWEAESRLDDCAFETLTYRGRAVFRLDLLTSRLVNNRQMVADDLRDYFGAFQLPPGFQREVGSVRQTPLGDACDYEFRDVQLPVTLALQGVQKLEAMWESGFESPGFEKVYTDFAFDVMDAPFEFSPKDPLAPIRELIKTGKNVRGNLPRTYETLVVTARGNPTHNRAALANVCYMVAAGVLALFQTANLVWPAVKLRLRRDLMGKWVQLLVTLQRGPAQSNALIINNFFNGLPLFTTPADDGMTYTPTTQALGQPSVRSGPTQTITTQAAGTQPAYPNQQGTRGGGPTGSVVETLVWQALTNVPWQAPTKPGASPATPEQGAPPPPTPGGLGP